MKAAERLGRRPWRSATFVLPEWYMEHLRQLTKVRHMDNTGNILKATLESYGAREFEIVALSGDPHRGLAAIQHAVAKGAERPISYATALYDNRDWNPKGELRRVASNQHVDRACDHCGGDRFVFVTDDPNHLYGESVAPCEKCNAEANASFYRVDGKRMKVVPA